LQREKKNNPDKSEKSERFKNGEATIRSVRDAQNFGRFLFICKWYCCLIFNYLQYTFLTFFTDYVQEIYETILSATEKDLKSEEAELKQMCPLL
jgi:hypothetical protein